MILGFNTTCLQDMINHEGDRGSVDHCPFGSGVGE